MCWDLQEQWFKFKGKVLSFTLEDIALVLGLGIGGSQVSYRRGTYYELLMSDCVILVLLERLGAKS
jgi:hypothetical protein